MGETLDARSNERPAAPLDGSMQQSNSDWSSKPMAAWMAGHDAALESVKSKLIEYGGDADGNIPLQVVFDAINAS